MVDFNGIIESEIQAKNLEAAESQVELGLTLHQRGDLEGAVLCYKHAISLNPGSYVAYVSLANVFASIRDFETSLIFYQAAAAIATDVAEIHNKIAHAYLDLGKIPPAIDSYRRAIALEPQAAYYNHLGNALRLDSNDAEAEACMREALLLDPTHAEAYVNLGYLLFEAQRIDAAKAACYYRQAISHKPVLAQAHVNLSQALLQCGDFRQGWAEQEWRWQWAAFPSPRRNFKQPQWRGEEIQGKRILLHAEQGFGDTIQFLRYVPLVGEKGAHIILEVHPELKRLAKSVKGVAELVSRGDALPEFDWQCPLLSLPLAFDTELQTIPAPLSYLQAVPQEAGWINKKGEGTLRVGVAWSGGAKNLVDHRRSFPSTALEPLWRVEGVSFYCLQHRANSNGREAAHFKGMLPGGDFANTAACMAQLDLIISVDTAVAHLAGALGLPVWILLPRMSDWRWLVDREDSPWYPSARLFRQQADMQWEPVIERVVTELSRFVKAPREDSCI